MYMKKIFGRKIILSQWTEDDLGFLFECRNDISYRSFCSMRKKLKDFEEFKKEISYDFNKDREDQFIIINKRTKDYMGTIFIYDMDLWHQNCFITVFLKKGFRNIGYGVESFCLLCEYLFKKYKLNKIIIDVYSNNFDAIKIINKTNFQKEGHFKNHRRDISGEWLDVFRYSLFKIDFINIYKSIKN